MSWWQYSDGSDSDYSGGARAVATGIDTKSLAIACAMTGELREKVHAHGSGGENRTDAGDSEHLAMTYSTLKLDQQIKLPLLC